MTKSFLKLRDNGVSGVGLCPNPGALFVLPKAFEERKVPRGSLPTESAGWWKPCDRPLRRTLAELQTERGNFSRCAARPRVRGQSLI